MSKARIVKVGTRASPLALAQTEEAVHPLVRALPEIRFETVTITPDGDRRKSMPLLSMERGMFVKELEAALLTGEIDIAVHSAKDMPAELPKGLVLAAFPERNDPRDVLVDRWSSGFDELPGGARLGTSSPRRAAQIKHLRPDIDVVPVRGNVGTRLERAMEKPYDGVILAAAGVARLGRESEVHHYFSPETFTPDAGQGALAVETRSSDDELHALLVAIDHAPTRTAVTAERAFITAIGGGCKIPVAAYAEFVDGSLRISAMAGLPDGSSLFRVSLDADPSAPEAAGRSIAQALTDSGAAEILSRETPP
ncbi:MAG: hydroxymethylbilane synthase [SAR202 cluster bacterium]|nr:hydroxymethylbilane synthase [SAR202 cluster bacterium]MDP6665347.1 hydroxymethylbilane synthase [SAR202 cluster bacterium]MDP6799600.1 hydroxymethylbilane synthase [SAR202 cluster bacterium]